MKVVINALPLKQNSSGIGMMLRELFGQYVKQTRSPCQVILPQDGPDFPAAEGTELVRCRWRHDEGLRRIFFQAFQMGRMYCRDAVLLTTDSKAPFFLPRDCTLATIVTDLAVFRMPDVYQRSRVFLWRAQYRYVCRRAGMFFAISAFTKREMEQVLHIPPEKICVIPCACSAQMHRVEDTAVMAALRERYGLRQPFVLFVGNSNPRKNLERTIRAFDAMKRRTGLPHELVIAGGQGWKFDRERALEGVGCREAVRFVGYVPDEDMPGLYSAAELFVFPTLYEGFGIPVLEAQACGVPVVTSDCTSLPEVAGEGAEYVDPYDEQSICQGMIRVLEDSARRQELTARGYENVKRYSWEKSAYLLEKAIERELTS